MKHKTKICIKLPDKATETFNKLTQTYGDQALPLEDKSKNSHKIWPAFEGRIDRWLTD